MRFRLGTLFVMVGSAVLVLVVVLILLVVIPGWQKELENGALKRGRAVVSLLAHVCAEPALAQNYSQLQRVVSDLAQDPQMVYVAILDRQGNVVVSSLETHSHEPFFALDRPVDDPMPRSAQDIKTVMEQKTTIRGMEVLDFVAPLVVYKRSWGLARLGLNLEPIERATASIRNRLLLLGLVGLLLGALFVIVLALGMTRPLARLVLASRQLSQRQLQTRVEIQGAKEIAELGVAFNLMAENIQKHVREIEQKSSELEAGYRVLTRLSTTVDRKALMEGVLEVLTSVLPARSCELMAFDPRQDRVDRFVFGEAGYESGFFLAKDFGLKDFQNVVDMSSLIKNILKPNGLDLFLPLRVGKFPMGGLLLVPKSSIGFSAREQMIADGISTHLLVALENARLYDLAIRDSLTGLTIRRYFLIRLSEELDRAKRYQQPFSLLMIDIDHFKEVNDQHGHSAGDMVLREIAQRLSLGLRASDLVSRYGGEELCVLLPGQDREEGKKVAEKLRELVATKPFAIGDSKSISVFVSIGVAAFPKDSSQAEELIDKADLAMYAAKQTGRNRVNVSLGEMDYSAGAKERGNS